MNALIEYIGANRGRYTRKAITDQLIAAGHDLATIEEAWAVADAAATSAASAGPRTRYWPVTLGLTAAGAVLTFVIWQPAATNPDRFPPEFATVSYVITVLVVMGVGIGVTRAASGGAWVAVVVVGVISTGWLLWLTVANFAFLSGYDIALGFGAAAVVAVATALAIALHRYQAQIPYLAYALPVLGWLAITGVCASPLVTG